MPGIFATAGTAAAVAVVSWGAWSAFSADASAPSATRPAQALVRDADSQPVLRLDTIACASRTSGTASEVAVIDFRGGISAIFNSDGVYGLLNAIGSDPRIGAVALRIDSAGGDSYASKKLYESLRKLRAACALPMAGFAGNVSTSGGFWLLMAAGEMHADTLSTVGAVGVMAIFNNEMRKLEKEGITKTVIRTGERKWPLMPYAPVAEEDVKKIRDSLALVQAEFLSAVEDARKGKLKLTREQIATGEAWMGSDAVALGLVDEPAEIDAVMTRLLKGPVTAYRRFDLARAATMQPVPAPAPAPAMVSRDR